MTTVFTAIHYSSPLHLERQRGRIYISLWRFLCRAGSWRGKPRHRPSTSGDGPRPPHLRVRRTERGGREGGRDETGQWVG